MHLIKELIEFVKNHVAHLYQLEKDYVSENDNKKLY